MKKGRHFTTERLCLIGIMIAVHFLLSKLSISIVNLRITLASLPIVVLAVLNGPADAAIAALLSEFLIQLTGRYGLTPTTPLWCLPPVIRALTVGFGCKALNRRVQYGNKKYYIWYFLIVMTAALLTTISNTAVTWLDSVIFHYYSYAYVFGQLLIRLVDGVITAILVGYITLQVAKALRHIKKVNPS